jgi:uncharacterized membrane protein YgaE (UPF0421/DUF939 family)
VARTSISNVHITQPLLATLKQFKWKRVAIVYQLKSVQWEFVYKYLSKKLSDDKHNITVAHEEGVELKYDSFHKGDFQSLETSLKVVRTKARSKYEISFIHYYILPCSFSF